MARLVVRVVVVLVGINHAHIECHFTGVIGGNQHLRFFLRFRQGQPSQYRRITRLCELHQFLDELFLHGCRRYIVQYLVFLRPVHAYIRCRAVIGNLIIESRQLRHFDKIAEPFFLYHLIRNRKLKVGGLLGKNSRPRVEAVDVLPFQFLWAEIFEQQV